MARLTSVTFNLENGKAISYAYLKEFNGRIGIIL
jgi:hypothetical protein